MENQQQGQNGVTLGDVRKWHRRNILKDGALKTVLEMVQPREAWLAWMGRSAGMIGTALLICGAIFFFAYNWADLGKTMKLMLPWAGVAVGLVGWIALGVDGLWGRLSLMLAAVFCGIAMAVFGQIYQTGADAWELFTAWTLLLLPWAIVCCWEPLWLLTLVVGSTALETWWDQVGFECYLWPRDWSYVFGGLFWGLALVGRETGRTFGVKWLQGGLWVRWFFLFVLLGYLTIPTIELIMSDLFDDIVRADTADLYARLAGAICWAAAVLATTLVSIRIWKEHISVFLALSSAGVVVWSAGLRMMEPFDFEAGVLFFLAVITLGIASPIVWVLVKLHKQFPPLFKDVKISLPPLRLAYQKGAAPRVFVPPQTEDVLQRLREDPDWDSSGDQAIAGTGSDDRDISDMPPIVASIVAGFGAWVTGICLFLAIVLALDFDLDASGVFIVLGMISLTIAVGLLRSTTRIFAGQFGLSMLTVGTLFLLGGVVKEGIAAVFFTQLIATAVLYPATGSRVYQFVSPISVAILGTIWAMERNYIFYDEPETYPVGLAIWMILLGLLPSVLLYFRSKLHPMAKPLLYSSCLMLPVSLLIASGTYASIRGHIPACVVAAGGFMVLAIDVVRQHPGLSKREAVSLVLLGVIMLVTGQPLLPFIALLLLCGHADGDWTLSGFGWVLLPLWLWKYYLALNPTLLQKSYMLAAGGAGLVIAGIAAWLAARSTALKQRAGGAS